MGSGGAQRQMTCLLAALSSKGHDVHLLLYYRQFQHFLPEVHAVGVEPIYVDSSTKLGRIWAVRRAIRRLQPDCVISYLNSPNILAALSSPGLRRIPVIVSERSLDIDGVTKANRLRFNIFRLVDQVVANSESQAQFIRQSFPFLASRVTTIRNCVSLPQMPSVRKSIHSPRRIVVGASVNPAKNVLRFIRGVAEASQVLPPQSFVVDWFGNNFFQDGKPTAASEYYLQAIQLVRSLNLQNIFFFHSAVNDLPDRLVNYDAACLPSIFEGCPNFICEAMAAGLPILSSQIGDIPEITGQTCGWLFDPNNESDIANQLIRFVRSDAEELQQMGYHARTRAVELFSQESFSDAYEAIIRKVVKKEGTPTQ